MAKRLMSKRVVVLSIVCGVAILGAAALAGYLVGRGSDDVPATEIAAAEGPLATTPPTSAGVSPTVTVPTTTTAAANPLLLRVNFGPAGTSVPDGFVLDTGAAFDDERGHGWVSSADSTPLERSSATAQRAASTDSLTDTLAHLDVRWSEDSAPWSRVEEQSRWELVVDNGMFLVTAGVGDPLWPGGTHVINAEDVPVVDGFLSDLANLHTTKTAVVEVTDGRLTIDAVGGTNTALNYVVIEALHGDAPELAEAAASRQLPRDPVSRALGFYPGFADASDFERLEQWLGRDLAVIVQFGSRTRGGGLIGSLDGQLGADGGLRVLGDAVRYVLTIPLAFGDADARSADGRSTIAASLDATAAGGIDGAVRATAEILVEAGHGDAIIRLGPEFDGDWNPWSAVGNCERFRAAYRHAADELRAISAEFVFDYNGTIRNFGELAVCAYPGDEYVDVIGLDLYDRGAGSAYFDEAAGGWADPQLVWDEAFRPLLELHLEFALEHGKPVSFPEWGLFTGDSETVRGYGGDNPTFVREMYEWLSSLPEVGPGSLLYHSYFSSGPHTIELFPEASETFRTIFKG